jgi:hypothetical protein
MDRGLRNDKKSHFIQYRKNHDRVSRPELAHRRGDNRTHTPEGQDLLWNLLDGNTLSPLEPIMPGAVSAAYDMGRVLNFLYAIVLALTPVYYIARSFARQDRTRL